MNRYYNQYLHNLDFLENIHTTFENEYFDWKVTVSYYTALHLVKSYAIDFYNVEIRSHDDATKFLLSKYGQDGFKLMSSLLSMSYSVRYNGIVEYNRASTNFEESFLLCKIKLDKLKALLSRQKK